MAGVAYYTFACSALLLPPLFDTNSVRFHKFLQEFELPVISLESSNGNDIDNIEVSEESVERHYLDLDTGIDTNDNTLAVNVVDYMSNLSIANEVSSPESGKEKSGMCCLNTGIKATSPTNDALDYNSGSYTANRIDNPELSDQPYCSSIDVIESDSGMC